MSNKIITQDELRRLCYEYNESDIGALLYIKENNLCYNNEQVETLNKLIDLNDKLFSMNSEGGTMQEQKEYNKKKIWLLSSFGVKFDYGDAYCD